MIERGLSERRALRAVRMSPSAFRYAPRPDRNVELREEIVALAWIFRLMRSQHSGTWEATIPEHGKPPFRAM